MRTRIKWSNYALFFFIFLSSISCNNRGNKKAALIGDPLYVLFTDKATFQAFPNGTIVFSFVASNAGKITLHGWKFRGPGQDYQPPVLQLNPGLSSNITLNAGIYLGNIFINANDKAAIDLALQQPDANFVALVPDPLSPGTTSITYSIYVVKDDPSQVYPKKIGALGDTNLDANPSPPRAIN
jgi:hypothetical protein